jgi:hypothetical protein
MSGRGTEVGAGAEAGAGAGSAAAPAPRRVELEEMNDDDIFGDDGIL